MNDREFLESVGLDSGRKPRHEPDKKREPHPRARTEREAPSKRYVPEPDVVLDKIDAKRTSAADVAGLTFEKLGLGENLVRALAELGATAPFPIQAATIPDVIAGHNVLGRAQTGSGKTIAFGVAIVERLLRLKAEGAFAEDARRRAPAKLDRGRRQPRGRERPAGRKPKAMIIAPTRELALQIDRTVQPLARAVGLYTTQVYGGVPQQAQVEALRRGVDIVIGTPGRMEDLIDQRELDLREVRIAVLDEADHMGDLGFLEPVQRLLRRTASGAQTLLFSATLDQRVNQIIREFLPKPRAHEVSDEDAAREAIDHHVIVVRQEQKIEVLTRLVDRPGKVLVFARTKAYVEQLTAHFESAGISAAPLHGDLNQAQRQRHLQQLKSGRVSVLVATDVAARGIHVDDIDLVVQADLPDDYKTYLHRAGRTGRAGETGTVASIVTPNGQRRVRELLKRADVETASFGSFIPGEWRT